MTIRKAVRWLAVPAIVIGCVLGQVRPEVEIVTLTPRGFTPTKVIRRPGTFRLLIQNTTPLKEVDFDITGNSAVPGGPAAKIQDLPINGKSGKRRSELLTLAPGKYKLRVQSKQNWTMDIEIR